jgi:tripartite-type tricarboxylate transporter receptor subunit TctC
MAEAGQADFVVTSWSIFAVPSATPRPILDRLSAVLREIAQDAGAQRRAFGTGARLLGSTPEAALQWIAREKPRWAEMVRLSGARAE